MELGEPPGRVGLLLRRRRNTPRRAARKSYYILCVRMEEPAPRAENRRSPLKGNYRLSRRSTQRLHQRLRAGDSEEWSHSQSHQRGQEEWPDVTTASITTAKRSSLSDHQHLSPHACFQFRALQARARGDTGGTARRTAIPTARLGADAGTFSLGVKISNWKSSITCTAIR